MKFALCALLLLLFGCGDDDGLAEPRDLCIQEQCGRDAGMRAPDAAPRLDAAAPDAGAADAGEQLDGAPAPATCGAVPKCLGELKCCEDMVCRLSCPEDAA